VSRTVNVIESARKELKQIPRAMADRTLKAIYQYAFDGYGDIMHLAGKPNRWRLRVGDYRVIMEITPDTITVLRVAHRREVYRDQ
jgi:mRNA interferase RelE/StbE